MRYRARPAAGGDLSLRARVCPSELELSHHDDHGELRVDGEASDAVVPPELERLGEASGDSYYAEAERIDGDLWEVKVTAL